MGGIENIAMNIGIMSVKDLLFHPTRRLEEAARQRGFRVMLINPYDMVSGIADNAFYASLSSLSPLPDVVMPRQGAPMGDYGLALLRQFMHLGIPLINGLEGITIARNQYIALQTLAGQNLPVPDSFFITSIQGCYRAVAHLGGYPVIVKQMDGMGGEGVRMVRGAHEVDPLCREILKDKKGAVVQRLIPPQNRQDLRILVVGQKVAGAMALTPAPGEFRSNFHLHGQARPITLTREWQTLALEAARACHLEIAGVDLIIDAEKRPYLMEINSAPGFRGLESVTHMDIAGIMMDHVSKKCKNKEGKADF